MQQVLLKTLQALQVIRTSVQVAAMTPTYFFITLGCAKNEADTLHMKEHLEAAGYKEATCAQAASILFVNTCGFLQAATEESLATIFELRDLTNAPIVICGCVPSRYGTDLEDELSEVNAFLPCAQEHTVVEVARTLLKETPSAPNALAASQEDVYTSADALQEIAQGSTDDSIAVHEGKPNSYAYIKISDGCERCCTFCAIPSIRGTYQSRPLKDILEEAHKRVEQGAKELILVAQDTAQYGRDFDSPFSLARLLYALDKEVGDAARIRVLYIQPDECSDELISAFKQCRSLIPYFDIPIQHSQKDILAAMGRDGNATQYKALFERIKSEIPDAIIRTTALLGFPGETDKDVDAFLTFLRTVHPHYLSVFSYSAEEGTVAASLENQIPEEEKRTRAQRFYDLAEELAFAHLETHIGESIECIVDGWDEELQCWYGHAPFQSPDLDGVVQLPGIEGVPGDKIMVKIIDRYIFDLIGEQESSR